MRPALGGAAAVLLAVWWWAPSFGGDARQVDTLVVHDGMLGPEERPVSDRLNEAGRTIEWRMTADVCAELTRGVDERIDVVVLAGADLGGCGSAIDALHREAVITVGDGARAIDTTALLGDSTTVAMPCQWWDAVCDGGSVVVRNGDGSLTDAGLDRIGRLIAAELP